MTQKSGGGGGEGALPGQFGTDAWAKDCETYPKQCAQHITKQVPFSLCSPQKVPLITMFSYVSSFKTVKTFRYSSIMVPSLYFYTLSQRLFIRFEKIYFPQKCYFSDPKRWQRCALPSLTKSTHSHRFLFKHRYQVDKQALLPRDRNVINQLVQP